MRWTQTLITTQKEAPDGAKIPSHILMLRAGLISQTMAGVYAYLPLGLKSLRKAENIVREEMNRAGAVELLMSALTPLSLWEQTNRVEAFGNVLMKFNLNRAGTSTPVALCPTHEEPITDIVSRYVSSYRQLPITLYQIQTKFRNEERPRSGVMRTSEFVMKDAYSFDASLEGLDASFNKMYDAYHRIFDRAGLTFLPVDADSGAIGGNASKEFMVLGENGEDNVVVCPECKYAANTEKAEIGENSYSKADEPLADVQKVQTPGTSSIEAVCKFLNCTADKMLKTMIFEADGKPVVIVVRGDHEVNEIKVKRLLGAKSLELASPETITRVTGAPVGFAGPVGLKENVPVYADVAVKYVVNAVTGANAAGEEAHITGVNPGRDFEPTQYADVRNAVAGDSCPKCGNGKFIIKRGMEVGHVFKLGTKYSEALGAKFLDADGQALKTIIMGCYGIGVARILAGCIENSYDEKGIVWPVSIAPYEVCIVPMRVNDDAVMTAANKIHDELLAAGVDVVIDDRDARPGVKFNDIDLIGFPLRVVVGPKGLANNEVELKWRWDADCQNVPLEDAVKTIADAVATERVSGDRFNAAKKARS